MPEHDGPKLVKYEVRSLDMWGHVSADCTEGDCSCVAQCEECEGEGYGFDEHGNLTGIECEECGGNGTVHDDDACECTEECNDQFKSGTIEVSEDADNDAILQALLEERLLSEKGRKECVIDDYSDGSFLDVNDKDGRRIFHLVKEEND